MSKVPGFPTMTMVLGGMNLKVPAHWNSGHAGNGRWWVGDIDETITLYVQIERLDVREKADSAHSKPTVNAETYVAQTVELLRTIPLAGEIEINRIQSGHLVHAVTNYEE